MSAEATRAASLVAPSSAVWAIRADSVVTTTTASTSGRCVRSPRRVFGSRSTYEMGALLTAPPSMQGDPLTTVGTNKTGKVADAAAACAIVG